MPIKSKSRNAGTRGIAYQSAADLNAPPVNVSGFVKQSHKGSLPDINPSALHKHIGGPDVMMKKRKKFVRGPRLMDKLQPYENTMEVAKGFRQQRKSLDVSNPRLGPMPSITIQF